MLRTLVTLICTTLFASAASPEIDRLDLEEGQLSIAFRPESGMDHRLEASSDLENWSTVALLPAHLSQTSSTLWDPGRMADSTRFFRLVAEPASSENRPNIVFIMSDDQAPWSTGASGNLNAITPAMDSLFADGATFANSFVTTPVCSPSRASLMTSRYGSELGITDWINSGPEPELGLDPALPNWPSLLNGGGYRTGLVGKWHLGSRDRFHPTQLGYDHFMGFRGGGTSPQNPSLEQNRSSRTFSGFTPDILTDNAIEFLRDSQTTPFALSLHFRAPHTAWLPVAQSIWSEFENLTPFIPNPRFPNLDVERVRRMTREYLASVTSVDVNVARILTELETLDLDHKTIVIFTSDHGYNMGHNGIWHKGNGHWVLTSNPPATANIPNGQRPNMYDNSLRVPTAVRWPGVIRPGLDVTQTISNLDWFPTLLAMAGVGVPEETVVRGRSLLPLMKGQVPDDWNNDFYGEYSTHHQSQTHMRVYRTPRWKLIRDFLNDGRDEFYDLQNDPTERVNLIDAESVEIQDAVAELHGKIVAEMRAINDPVAAIFDDTEPPSLLEATSNGTLGGVALSFSEPLDRASAESPGNYSISGLTVISAALNPDERSVSITTSEQVDGATYEVHVSGVRDKAYSANTLESASLEFTAVLTDSGALLLEIYSGISGTSVSALRGAGKFPDSPDSSTLVTEFEIPINASDNYGARLSGFVIPDETGDYVFHLSSDDNGELWLSSDDSTNNLRLIAEEPSWNRPRTWTGTDRRDLVDVGTAFERRENVSQPIRLEAGQRYAVEALVKDGQGGDNLAVAWRRASEPPPEDGSSPIQGTFLAPALH